MKKTILILILMTGCVSPKKYNALMSEYQKAGEQVRSLGQEIAVTHAELQEAEAQKLRLRAKLDSLTEKEVSDDK
jgi:outer membrane murein-binding lipoprotein Lpp